MSNPTWLFLPFSATWPLLSSIVAAGIPCTPGPKLLSAAVGIGVALAVLLAIALAVLPAMALAVLLAIAVH